MNSNVQHYQAEQDCPIAQCRPSHRGLVQLLSASLSALALLAGCRQAEPEGVVDIGYFSFGDAPILTVGEVLGKQRPAEGQRVQVVGVIEAVDPRDRFWLRNRPFSVKAPFLLVELQPNDRIRIGSWHPIGCDCIVDGIATYEEHSSYNRPLRDSIRDECRACLTDNDQFGHANCKFLIRATGIRVRTLQPWPQDQGCTR